MVVVVLYLGVCLEHATTFGFVYESPLSTTNLLTLDGRDASEPPMNEARAEEPLVHMDSTLTDPTAAVRLLEIAGCFPMMWRRVRLARSSLHRALHSAFETRTL